MAFEFKSEYSGVLEAFQSKHTSNGSTLILAETDPALKVQPRDRQRCRDLASELVDEAPGAQLIDHTDTGLLIACIAPAAGLKLALLLQAELKNAERMGPALFNRIGLHYVEHAPGAHAFGHRDHLLSAIILTSLCKTGQILLSGPTFEIVRQSFKAEKGAPPLTWANYGPYLCTDPAQTLDICEVTAELRSALEAPADSELARRAKAPNDQTAWGWRPAVGVTVPGTRCMLLERSADARLGEVWIAHDEGARERRMFHFCFRNDWAALLKQEEGVYDVLKKRIGNHRNTLNIYGFSFDKPPFYVVTEHFEGKDLKTWCQDLGGLVSVPFNTRLEIVAQIATALQAVHEAKLVHRDIQPAHVLIAGTGTAAKDVQVKLTDFSVSHIGQLPTPVPPPSPAPAPDLANATEADAKPVAAVASENLYQAPELAGGEAPSARSDTYSLSVLLSQMVLGDFTQALTAERMKEILTVLARDSIFACFAENPQERTQGSACIARELRSLTKERESRTWAISSSQRRFVQATVMICALVAGIFSFIYYKQNYSKPPGQNEPEEEEILTQPPISRGIYGGKPKELKAKKSAPPGQLIFQFLVFPVIGVVLVGSVVQKFGPQIAERFHRPKLPAPPIDE